MKLKQIGRRIYDWLELDKPANLTYVDKETNAEIHKIEIWPSDVIKVVLVLATVFMAILLLKDV
jgi:hypothetical protein